MITVRAPSRIGEWHDMPQRRHNDSCLSCGSSGNISPPDILIVNPNGNNDERCFAGSSVWIAPDAKESRLQRRGGAVAGGWNRRQHGGLHCPRPVLAAAAAGLPSART